MAKQTAFGLTLEELDVIIVEDSKPMQTLIRSIVAALHPARIRQFDSADSALEAMLTEPPNLIISDWRMKPMSGYQLLKTIRNHGMAPLCFVPVLIVTAHATREVTRKAFLAGAQQVVVKPLSPAVLIDRINFVLRDSRELVIGRDTRITISGVDRALAQQENRLETLQQARTFHQTTIQRIEAQNAVDHLLEDEMARPGERPAQMARLPAAPSAPMPQAMTPPAKAAAAARPPVRTPPMSPPPVRANPAPAPHAAPQSAKPAAASQGTKPPAPVAEPQAPSAIPFARPVVEALTRKVETVQTSATQTPLIAPSAQAKKAPLQAAADLQKGSLLNPALSQAPRAGRRSFGQIKSTPPTP